MQDNALELYKVLISHKMRKTKYAQETRITVVNCLPYRLFVSRGFTLIEFILDIALLLILLAFVLILINPIKQLDKAKDAGRKHDAIEIRTALDAYYNDYGCYPKSIPFGQKWQENGVTYMEKVPQDPDCAQDPSSCYVYEVNSNQTCPQWQVTYVKQTASKVTSTDCPLKAFPQSCTPSNYNDAWACFISGSVDCNYVSSQPIFSPVPSGVPTPTQIFIPTPTPTPVQCNGVKQYACTGGPPARCNLVPAGSGVYCSSNCNGQCL